MFGKHACPLLLPSELKAGLDTIQARFVQTWQAGVNGAQQGIIMEANPRVGDKYQQEFAAGVAEDQAIVRDDRVNGPAET